MKIGIVAAMEVETAALLEKMGDYQEEVHAHQKFYIGEIAGQSVVLVQSGIGKVNAALATTLLIDHYGVQQVINSGVAGGIGQGLAVGDLVVSTECAYHDADNRVFDYAYGQIPQMPARFDASVEMLDDFEKIAEKEWNVRNGLIVSGDSFVASQTMIDHILHHFPEAQATEMEGAAVAQVCYQFEIPFLIIRAISDVADDEANQTYAEFVEVTGRRSAQLLIEWLGTL